MTRNHRWRRAKGGKPRVPGAMNKTEQAYSELLEGRRLAGEISAWAFESMKFRLADRTWYTPDFIVQLDDGLLEVHETKACRASGEMLIEDDAAVKIKVAAEQFSMFRFVLCGKKSRNQGWVFRDV